MSPNQQGYSLLYPWSETIVTQSGILSDFKMKLTDMAKPKQYFLLSNKLQFLLKCVAEYRNLKTYKQEITAWVHKMYYHGHLQFQVLEEEFFKQEDNEVDFMALRKIFLYSVDTCEHFTKKIGRCTCYTRHHNWIHQLKELSEMILSSFWQYLNDRENEVTKLFCIWAIVNVIHQSSYTLKLIKFIFNRNILNSHSLMLSFVKISSKKVVHGKELPE